MKRRLVSGFSVFTGLRLLLVGGLLLASGVGQAGAQQSDGSSQPAAPATPTATTPAGTTSTGTIPGTPTPAVAAPIATPSGSINADQARQTLDVLQNDAKRNQLIQVLQTIANAPGASTTGASAPAATDGSGAPATAAPAATPTPAPVATPTPAPMLKPATAPAPAPAAAAPTDTVVPLQADSLAAQLLEQGQEWLENAADTVNDAVRNIADLPRIWGWLVQTFTNAKARDALISAIWRLGVVLLCAGAADYALRVLLRTLLKKPIYLMEKRAAYLHGLAGLGGSTTVDELQPDAADMSPAATPSDPAETTPSAIDPGTPLDANDQMVPRDIAHLPKPAARGLIWLRRIPWAILRFLGSLLPVLAFAVVGKSLLQTDLVDSKVVALAGTAAITAYVIVRIVGCCMRFIVNSRSPGLRLLPIRDESAAYLEIWAFRIVGTVLFGGAAAQVARLLGMPHTGYHAVMKIIMLVAAVYVVIIILQSRHTVAAWLKARPGRTGLVPATLNRLGSSWHILAIFLVLGLWLVWAMDIQHGFVKLFNFCLVFIGVIVVARLLTLMLHALFDRLFHIDEETEKRFPGLKLRANRYYPLLRGAISLAVTAFGVILLLQAWGLDAFEWFRGDEIGSRLLSAVITVAIAGLVACAVWEGTNIVIDRHMLRLDNGGDYAHAARLRTLMPILKTVLLVVVSIVVILTILSQLGVNIAPLLAGASIIGVAIGFGSQKLVQDFITGIFLLLENAMQVGDSITASGLSGVVEKLSIRTIRLRAGDGAVHIIPFSSVGTVTNVNRGVGNAAVKVSVAASEDYDRVGEVLKNIAKEMRKDDNFRRLMRSDLQLWGVDEVQAGAMTIAGQIVCSDAGRWGVQREFNRRLLKRFAELGIRLANPAQFVVTAQATEVAAMMAEQQEAAAAQKTVMGAAAPAKTDSPTSMRNSPPPTALGHTE